MGLLFFSQRCFLPLLQTFGLSVQPFCSWLFSIWIFEEAGANVPSLLPLVTNFIMKAFINGRKLFGTPFYPIPGTEVVRPFWLSWIEKVTNMNAACSASWGTFLSYLLFPFVFCCRTTSLTRRCWPTASWRPTTGAAGSAGRSGITWRTVQRDAGCPPFVHGTVSLAPVEYREKIKETTEK